MLYDSVAKTAMLLIRRWLELRQSANITTTYRSIWYWQHRDPNHRCNTEHCLVDNASSMVQYRAIHRDHHRCTTERLLVLMTDNRRLIVHNCRSFRVGILVNDSHFHYWSKLMVYSLSVEWNSWRYTAALMLPIGKDEMLLNKLCQIKYWALCQFWIRCHSYILKRTRSLKTKGTIKLGLNFKIEFRNDHLFSESVRKCISMTQLTHYLR